MPDRNSVEDRYLARPQELQDIGPVFGAQAGKALPAALTVTISRAEHEALKADRERLRFVPKLANLIIIQPINGHGWRICATNYNGSRSYGEGATFEGALDAARGGGK